MEKKKNKRRKSRWVKAPHDGHKPSGTDRIHTRFNSKKGYWETREDI